MKRLTALFWGTCTVITECFRRKRRDRRQNETIKKAGKKVYYQTSCYLTDPLFEQTVRNICYWKQQDLLDGVFLQDVGLLHRLGQLNDGLQLIWSYMGVARNRAVNLLHYQFLRTLAPVTIAVDKPSHYRILREHGIDTMLMYGRITYATVNRLCYYTYENNLYGIDCKRACLQGKQHMINETFNLDMSVDGYLLGKSIFIRNQRNIRIFCMHRIMKNAWNEYKY